MEPVKDSTAPASTEASLAHAPLAPSQELAYRKKCIQLKRRLAEVENNNDAVRRKIDVEKQFVQKQRLVRAILFNHLKTIMDAPGKKLAPEQLEQIGVLPNGVAHLSEVIGVDGDARPDGEGLLDDSSDASEDDPEPAERPERRRRPNNSYRESIMSTNASASHAVYQQPPLPSLAPAHSFSPAAPQDPAMLTSSFRVAQTPQANASAYPVHPHPYTSDSYAHSSPVSTPQRHASQSAYSNAGPVDGPGAATGPVPQHVSPQPARPEVPFVQFTAHMRPQLEADSYPPDQIEPRIQQEWDNLSEENRGLWEKRYEEQMREYTEAMDSWKRAQRQHGNRDANVSFSETRNRRA